MTDRFIGHTDSQPTRPNCAKDLPVTFEIEWDVSFFAIELKLDRKRAS